MQQSRQVIEWCKLLLFFFFLLLGVAFCTVEWFNLCVCDCHRQERFHYLYLVALLPSLISRNLAYDLSRSELPLPSSPPLDPSTGLPNVTIQPETFQFYFLAVAKKLAICLLLRMCAPRWINVTFFCKKSWR